MKMTVRYDPPTIPGWQKMAWVAFPEGHEECGAYGYGATSQGAKTPIVRF